MEGSRKKLITLKVLIHSIERSAIIVNITHLLVGCFTSQKSIDLYNVVDNLFVLPVLNNTKDTRVFFGGTIKIVYKNKRCLI